MGRFAECNDPTIGHRDNCTGAFAELQPDGTSVIIARRWSNPDTGNFDNVFMAILTLFEMSMLERWPDVMYHGMDSYAVNEAVRESARATPRELPPSAFAICHAQLLPTAPL
eukprot:1552005-Prymnesium_polylepis.1